MGMIASYEHPVAGTVKVVAPAVKMGATPAGIGRPAPLVGEHTREILAEYGMGAMTEQWLAAGTVGEARAKSPKP